MHVYYSFPIVTIVNCYCDSGYDAFSHLEQTNCKAQDTERSTCHITLQLIHRLEHCHQKAEPPPRGKEAQDMSHKSQFRAKLR